MCGLLQGRLLAIQEWLLKNSVKLYQWFENLYESIFGNRYLISYEVYDYGF